MKLVVDNVTYGLVPYGPGTGTRALGVYFKEAEGEFDYERDGFGEVEYDLDSTVNRIIEYMQGGCALKPEYRKRIDSFFAFDDKNNCKRVYEKIMELEDQD